jgi:hypothetical protein
MKNKKDTSAPLQEMAAPAVLKRLQSSAAKFAEQEDDAEARLAELYMLSPNAKETQDNKSAIARAEAELFNARDNFNKTAKALLNYDKGVATERKDGEKISVEEAREIWKQFVLCVNLAMEQHIIASSQTAALCDSPESFHISAAENWRSALTGIIDSAISDGTLPKWLVQ